MLQDFKKPNTINNNRRVKISSKPQILSFKNKGVSLYFGVLITSVLLAIVLGVSVIVFSQIKMIKGMGDSVVALYAADAGSERALYLLYREGFSLPFSTSSSVGSAFYSVNGYSSGTEDCPHPPNDYYCLKSVGSYQETERSIENSR